MFVKLVVLLIAAGPFVWAQQGLSPKEAKEMCVDVGAAEQKSCVETMKETGGNPITTELAKYLCSGVTEVAKGACIDKYLAYNYASVTGPNAGGVDEKKAGEMCSMVPASEADKCVKYMMKYGANEIVKEDADYLCAGAREEAVQGCVDGIMALNYEGITGGGLNAQESHMMCEDVGDDPADKKKCEDYMRHSGAAPITNAVAEALCIGNDDPEDYKQCVNGFLELNREAGPDAARFSSTKTNPKALSEKDATEMCANAGSKKRDSCIYYMKRNGNAPVTVAIANFLCAGAADKHKCANDMVLMNYVGATGPNAGGLSEKKADEMCIEVPEIEREKCEEYMEKYGKNPLTAEDVAYLCGAARGKDYVTCELSFDSLNAASPSGPAVGLDAAAADEMCDAVPAADKDNCVDFMKAHGGSGMTYDIATMLCGGVAAENQADCVGAFLATNFAATAASGSSGGSSGSSGNSGSSGHGFKAVTTTIARASPRFRGTAHILNGPE